MYFIAKESELLGKEIAFTHFAQFADAMTIVTKDKGVFVFDRDEDGEINIYGQSHARMYIFKQDYIRKALNDVGIITDEEMVQYKKELEEKHKKAVEDQRKRNEEYQYKQYLILKEKFEGKIN